MTYHDPLLQMHTLKVHVESTKPMLMHSTQGMDVTHPLVRELKSLTKKHASKKTEEDIIEIQRLEFMLALYRSKGEVKRPVIPADVIFAAIRDGAKAMRMGSEVTRSVQFIEEEFPLQYEGPTDADALWEDKRFVDSRTVKVGAARVLRTRPIFNEWALDFTVRYDPDHLDLDTLQRALVNAGARVGLGDYRPRYGRFNVQFG